MLIQINRAIDTGGITQAAVSPDPLQTRVQRSSGPSPPPWSLTGGECGDRLSKPASDAIPLQSLQKREGRMGVKVEGRGPLAGKKEKLSRQQERSKEKADTNPSHPLSGVVAG